MIIDVKVGSVCVKAEVEIINSPTKGVDKYSAASDWDFYGEPLEFTYTVLSYCGEHGYDVDTYDIEYVNTQLDKVLYNKIMHEILMDELKTIGETK